MTWDEIDSRKDDLLMCVEMFHPNSHNPTKREFTITAMAAEDACELARKYASECSPVEFAAQAIQDRNFEELYGVLNSTWFGAPESREVFSVPGFSLLCDILGSGVVDES